MNVHRFKYGRVATSEAVVVGRLDLADLGWADYFQRGHGSPACRALNRHALQRLRPGLYRKHKVRSGKCCCTCPCGSRASVRPCAA